MGGEPGGEAAVAVVENDGSKWLVDPLESSIACSCRSASKSL